MKLILPDAIWNPAQISGAAFLYFHEDKLALTLHPSVSTFLTGVDPASYLQYLEEQSPPWKTKFFKFYDLWRNHQVNLYNAYEVLVPLKEGSMSTILLSYDRGTAAWQASQEIKRRKEK
jgi:hypothetical protein